MKLSCVPHILLGTLCVLYNLILTPHLWDRFNYYIYCKDVRIQVHREVSYLPHVTYRVVPELASKLTLLNTMLSCLCIFWRFLFPSLCWSWSVLQSEISISLKTTQIYSELLHYLWIKRFVVFPKGIFHLEGWVKLLCFNIINWWRFSFQHMTESLVNIDLRLLRKVSLSQFSGLKKTWKTKAF